MRSWTHSKGLERSIRGNRNPAHPPSRGLVANNSDRVGRGGAGKRAHPCAGTQALAGPEGATALPPATRLSLTATRLATLMFYFCSFTATPPLGVNAATQRASIFARNRSISATAWRVPLRDTAKPMWVVLTSTA
jgi:hypothetical protein